MAPNLCARDRLKIISIRIRRWQVTWVSATILSEAGTSGGGWRGVVYGMLTRIVVKPGKRSELLEYLRWDAEVAKASEPGTWRFDVWEAEREPGVVYLYEAYKDRAAFEDHAKGDPYKKWDEVAGKTMEQVTDVIPLTESLVSSVDG